MLDPKKELSQLRMVITREHYPIHAHSSSSGATENLKCSLVDRKGRRGSGEGENSGSV